MAQQTGNCERCDRHTVLITLVNTRDRQQEAHLCESCVKIVIRPRTAWQVKK